MKKDEMKMWAGGEGWNIRNLFYWEQSSLAATEEQSLNVTLFRNKRFALNEMFQRNASKFAIFHVL